MREHGAASLPTHGLYLLNVGVARSLCRGVPSSIGMMWRAPGSAFALRVRLIYHRLILYEWP